MGDATARRIIEKSLGINSSEEDFEEDDSVLEFDDDDEEVEDFMDDGDDVDYEDEEDDDFEEDVEDSRKSIARRVIEKHLSNHS